MRHYIRSTYRPNHYTSVPSASIKNVDKETVVIADATHTVADSIKNIAEATYVGADATEDIAQATYTVADATEDIAQATNAVAYGSLQQAISIKSLSSAITYQGELIANAISLIADELKQKRLQEEFWMLQDRIDSYIGKLNISTILPILEKYAKPKILKMSNVELTYLANTIIGEDLKSEIKTIAISRQCSPFLIGKWYLQYHCLVYFPIENPKTIPYFYSFEDSLYNLQLRGYPTSINPKKDYRMYVPKDLYKSCAFNLYDPEQIEFIDSDSHQKVYAFVKPVIAHGWKTWSAFTNDYVKKLDKAKIYHPSYLLNYSLWKNFQTELNLTISMNNLRTLCSELHQAARMDIFSLKGINLQK